MIVRQPENSSASNLRLDQMLVERHGYASRSKARDAILRGAVTLNGVVVTRPGMTIGPGSRIEIADMAKDYVSRAALKLLEALKVAGSDPTFSPEGKIALDIGASTGGFTQVLLERGAAHVYAVDVGSGQLHESLRIHPRVTNIENLNARALTADHLDGGCVQFIVCDASFISLKLVLPPALHLADVGAAGIFLFKPQFEVGRAAIGKGGIVNDPGATQRALADMTTWLCEQQGWEVINSLPSPIAGGDGNREFLLLARKVMQARP